MELSFAVSRHSSFFFFFNWQNLGPWTKFNFVLWLRSCLKEGRILFIPIPYCNIYWAYAIVLSITFLSMHGYVPLGWSGLGSMIQDHLDHGTCTCTSNKPLNPFPDWIYQFLWCTLTHDLGEFTLLLISSIIRYIPTVNSDLTLWL